MLLLTRRLEQKIRIRLPDGRHAWIVLVELHPESGSVKLGIDAPLDCRIDRVELLPGEELPCTLRSYRTEALARRTADRMRDSGQLAPCDVLEPFLCGRCGRFHNSRVVPAVAAESA